MAGLTIKDIEVALNAYVSVCDWETLMKSIKFPEAMVPMAYARLTELTLHQIEVRVIFHSLLIAFNSV